MSMAALTVFFFLVTYCVRVYSQTSMNLLIVVESDDSFMLNLLNDAISNAERDLEESVISIRVSTVEVNREYVEESFEKVCAELYNGISLILDMTWTGWDKVRKLAQGYSIVYKRGDGVITPFVQAVDDYLMAKNATDAALIFEDERGLNQALYYLIGNSIIRLVVIENFNSAAVLKIRTMRPSPSYYVIYASTSNMDTYFQMALDGGTVKRDDIWTLVFTYNNYRNFRYISDDLKLNVTITILSMRTDVCCRLIGESSCTCPNDFQPFPYYFRRLISLMINLMNELQLAGISVEPKTGRCENKNLTNSRNNSIVELFNKNLIAKLSTNDTLFYIADIELITYKADIAMQTYGKGELKKFADWNIQNKVTTIPGYTIQPAKRFFRVGTIQAIPWSNVKEDPVTGGAMKDVNGKDIWEGYCIDFIQRLSDEMNFDYELVIPKTGDFGVKLPNGRWDGLVGDLSRGETDIVVAALTMTSEREEVIDFVAPYFEQSGLSIVMRKPVRKTSLFKFMTVLRLEVWLSIVGALTLTGIMIWLLDKYSPYSARNNKRLYPYPCREFTLKESFWFALTSFTPQGGGEAPKALSSRTLVAAYWLFVVLMLATFTANLAAFLTVERMQSPVQSLEQLARQSRINYTVVRNSTIHQYFINMKNAEDKLYKCVMSKLVDVDRAARVNKTTCHKFGFSDFASSGLSAPILHSIGALSPDDANCNVCETSAQLLKSDAAYIRKAKFMTSRFIYPGCSVDIHNVWKEITLNSTSDQIEYRVWDYPIKEQYGHILQAITQAGPVASAKEGFQKVIASENAEFAFIHDSSEIKYEVTRNCNLTEVGDVFSEQPYAIAVQQGSHLQEEISKMILDLQKDRYFESLAAKYWNQSLKALCPNSDDNEGITLESLGGVFIATLFGLALAMITLAGEVVYFRKRKVDERDKRKEKDKQKEQDEKIYRTSEMHRAFGKLEMKPAPTVSFIGKPTGPRTRVSHISVYPRHLPFKD